MSTSQQMQIRATVEVIRGILARLPDEASRLAVLGAILDARCRKCLAAPGACAGFYAVKETP